MAGISDILQSGSLAYTKPSPASVAARRALAQQLLKGSQIQNAGPLGALANTLGGAFSGYEIGQAANEETAGEDEVAKALAQALQNPNPSFGDLTSVAGNPWLNDRQGSLVNTLLGKQIDQQYPQMTAAQSDYLFGQSHPDFQQQGVDLSSTPEGRAQLADQYGLDGIDKQTYVLTGRLPGGNQTARAGVGNPINFRNKKTGEVRAVQPMTVGPGQDMLTGGALPGDPSDWEFVNPVEMAGQKAGIVGDIKTQVAARAALPGAQQAVEIANKATEALLNDTSGMAEQFGNTFGVPNQYIPDWMAAKGSPMARFRTELAQGQGQSFMQARQMLKGGGPITDFEGAKADAAFSRMQLAAQNNNQNEFMQAVRDFQDAVNSGYQKLLSAANGEYGAGQPGLEQGGSSPAGQQTTSTGIPWSLEDM